MRSLERTLADGRSYARAVMMAAVTVGMVSGATAHQQIVPAPERDALYQRWMRQWAKALLRVFGVQVHYVNAPPELRSGARLIVANHRSPLDITLMLATFGGSVLSRADLKDWPVLGMAAKSADTIFVDRDNARSGMLAVREIRRRLERGRTVIVFPEGGTFEGDEVRPFREGVFVAMRGLPVEVIPVGIAYDPGVEFFNETFMQHLQRVAARPITRVSLCFGEPQRPQGQRTAVVASVQAQVQELTHRARNAMPKVG